MMSFSVLPFVVTTSKLAQNQHVLCGPKVAKRLSPSCGPMTSIPVILPLRFHWQNSLIVDIEIIVF